MLITFERKVPQSSYTSQNDHKSKGYPSKTSKTAPFWGPRGAVGWSNGPFWGP